MRREELYLADLIDNARAVRGYLDGVTRERWDAEDILRDAVLYRMLLLGEIASALPDELRDHYPDVAWRQVRAFRNLAIHKYFGVDWAVVWKIAQEEPAVLEAQVLAIMRAEYPTLAKDYEAGPAPDSGTASLRRSRGQQPQRDRALPRKSTTQRHAERTSWRARRWVPRATAQCPGRPCLAERCRKPPDGPAELADAPACSLRVPQVPRKP
jgi:uncharacterized protein with HEPN domain